MPRLLNPILVAVVAVITAYAAAEAQPGAGGAPIDTLLRQVQTPTIPAHLTLADSDAQGLKQALAAARRGDRVGFMAARDQLTDPLAKKIATWAMVDVAGDRLLFFELDQARRDLAGWPRPLHRQQAAEKVIETGGLDPAATIAWFAGAAPTTPEGAMALAAAYQVSNRTDDAHALIRDYWRTQPFDADAQRSMLARFSSLLTPDDHVARAHLLLYSSHGAAVHDLLPLLPADQRALAEARIALRADARNAPALVAALPGDVRNDPGLAFERAGYLRRHDQADAAIAQLANFPTAPAWQEAESQIWTERRQLINLALRKQDYRAALTAVSNTGFTDPVDVTDAEFYAGWLSLSKLNDAAGADAHFARVQAGGTSPITQGRALYWRGRAHDALGDKAGAQAFYAQGAAYFWTFYGQLAAEKAGLPIRLGSDPQITPMDESRFEGRELVQAARILADVGERDLLRTFVQFIDDNLPTAGEYALLVDLARNAGDLDLGMRVVRTAAQKGYLLPDRGYPLRTAPDVATSADAALIFGITRQESGFDPSVRSSADARGMMQLLPATAQIVARKIGVSYSAPQLYDADYNMRLGAAYIGQIVDRFGGSYLLAAAGYNAGPNRPSDWMSYCGDPRAPGADPLDFVECIPFSQTRNYVMRVMEGMQVYRARLNNGEAAPTLAEDLKRGSPAVDVVADAAN